MRQLVLAILIYIHYMLPAYTQTKKEWRENSPLTILDFRAEAPTNREGQGQSYYLAGYLDFSLTKRTYKSMLSDINKTVITFYYPDSSWLQQGEGTEVLLKYAQMDFDILELHARKYRQLLYTQKLALSSPRIFQKARAAVISDMTKRQFEMQNAISESEGKRDAFHAQIIEEITDLAEFCLTCKPVKK